ncbi:helix-turn-helix domain-containing protein, partial [Planktothrix agardhii]|uniref:helix-turn-helix domain-containing protein n=1 Tax=Planktothrix agardhii TaxID=1160 RepID=UPI0020324026
MEKAFSYRFYPSPEQESLLRRTLGCVRLVYNKALHERTQGLKRAQKNLSRKQKGSKNREKARIKVAKVHLKI